MSTWITAGIGNTKGRGKATGDGFPGQPESTLSGINRELDRAVSPFALNEAMVEDWLDRIDAWIDPATPAYWLMLARLHEAALLTAGNYADNGEFPAAGDLLFNPRRIMAYFKNSPQPVAKNRRGAISAQFNSSGAPRSDFIAWFRQHAILRETHPPLLPFLHGKISESGKIRTEYLDSGYARMQKIAATISFLGAWGVSRFETLVERRQTCDRETRRFAESQLCRFDTGDYFRMGEEIRQIEENRTICSRFLAA
ncbi:MAG: hypothetical protein ACOZF0_18150 [Thermodesulfobacteriota bacterium]